MKHEREFIAEIEPVRDRQWIFDQVVRHYRKQGRRCPPEGNCYYRHQGDKCFAGALIDDAHYVPAMESYIIREVIDEFSLPGWFRENESFLTELQGIHDRESNWARGVMDLVLKDFAHRHGLEMTP